MLQSVKDPWAPTCRVLSDQWYCLQVSNQLVHCMKCAELIWQGLYTAWGQSRVCAACSTHTGPVLHIGSGASLNWADRSAPCAGSSAQGQSSVMLHTTRALDLLHALCVVWSQGQCMLDVEDRAGASTQALSSMWGWCRACVAVALEPTWPCALAQGHGASLWAQFGLQTSPVPLILACGAR